MTETWRDIPGYEGLYQIDQDGQIKSINIAWRKKKVKLIAMTRTAKGYLTASLHKDNQKTWWRVHRLVMLAFVGASDLQVNHINGKKDDNRLENLEYVTAKENIRHADQTLGRIGRGTNNSVAKLNDQKVREMRQSYAVGETTYKELATKYGVNLHTAYCAINGVTWKHVDAELAKPNRAADQPEPDGA